MQIKHEIINYGNKESVWAGKYKNSRNLPHWHYDCELLWVESGAVDIICDKRTYTIAENQAFFIDSEQLHSLNAQTNETVLATIFFKRDLIRQFTSEIALATPVLSLDYGVERFYRETLLKLREKKPFYELDASLGVTTLMLEIFRNEPTVPRPKAKQTTESFKKLLSLMAEDLEFFSFEKAADFMKMNPAYFSRFFHNLTGMPFSRYLNFIKINRAVSLLQAEKDIPVTEIAIQCGFSTIRTFNRVFREMTGYAPTNLPASFILDESFSRSASSGGNPTLTGCELIESP